PFPFPLHRRSLHLSIHPPPYRTPTMCPPPSRIIYFTLDTDRLLTNFDTQTHQQFIQLGEKLGLTYVGIASDPRQLEQENKNLKEQVEFLSLVNNSLVPSSASLNHSVQVLSRSLLEVEGKKEEENDEENEEPKEEEKKGVKEDQPDDSEQSFSTDLYARTVEKLPAHVREQEEEEENSSA
ncbi:hypothetical protein PFISCL1PPCAC_19279, partial [Pristionchus fissidentatus]